MSLTVYYVTLDCRHVKAVQAKPPPGIGDEVWCTPCARYRYVPFYSPQWIADCTVCTYRRRQGVVREWAEIQARKHGYRKGHRVIIWREDSPEQQIAVPMSDNPLPDPGLPTPF